MIFSSTGRKFALLATALWLAAPGPARAAGDIQTLPVQVAAQLGDVGKIEQLLAKGADPNTRDETGQTPLITASLAGQELHRSISD